VVRVNSYLAALFPGHFAMFGGHLICPWWDSFCTLAISHCTASRLPRHRRPCRHYHAGGDADHATAVPAAQNPSSLRLFAHLPTHQPTGLCVSPSYPPTRPPPGLLTHNLSPTRVQILWLPWRGPGQSTGGGHPGHCVATPAVLSDVRILATRPPTRPPSLFCPLSSYPTHPYIGPATSVNSDVC